MSGNDLVMDLAGRWNIPRDATTPIIGDRIVACRWRYSVPQFPDTTLPANVLYMLLSRSQARRRTGSRVTEASRAPLSLGLVPQGSCGAWDFDLPADVLNIYLPATTLAETALQMGLSANEVALHDDLMLDDPLLQSLCREVAASLDDESHGRLYADTLAGAIEARLLRAHSNVASPVKVDRVRGGLAPWQQRRCAELLAERLSDDISLAELAAQAGLSSFHFCRAFKQSTGLPPHAYQRRLRAEKARELLAMTTLPVTEIAAIVGYETPQAFARMFRAQTGASPSDYRRELGR